MSELSPQNPPPVLNYAAPAPAGTAVVSRCANIAGAEMVGGMLEGEGTPYQVHNAALMSNRGLYAAGRAQSVLEDAEEEAGEEDDPRCPRCSAWRVHPIRSGGILRGIGQPLG